MRTSKVYLTGTGPGDPKLITLKGYELLKKTERNKTSTLGFITGHEDPAKLDSAIDWKALVKALGTMVFLMGTGNLVLIVKKLIECGKPKNTPVALIRWGTTDRQKTIIGVLNNIVELARKNSLTPPAIIVVGKTVELRKELNWFENKPLFARRIIVTRTKEQASLLAEGLRELGAEVIEIPTIKVVSLNADSQIKDAFASSGYDWIFFTSQNGSQEFRAFLERTGKDSRIFGKSKICAIGSETAKSLRGMGMTVDYVPEEFVAEAIVKHFKGLKFKGTHFPRALILRAKKARDILPAGLRNAGFKVKIIDLYDTVLPQESVLDLKKAFREQVDYVTFTSSSTVENFIKLLGNDYRRKLRGVKCVSIGPVTSGTLKKFGLKAALEAKVYTIDGLITALEQE